MHEEASAWVESCAIEFDITGRVLEFGGRNVNGGVRFLIPHDEWCSVDIRDGRDVDVVGDAATVTVLDDGLWDVVVCAEVFEHTPDSEVITANAARHLREGGHFIATMAGPGRGTHSADGGQLTAGEYYGNVEPEDLHNWLHKAGFMWWKIDKLGPDVRCVARR